MRTLLVVATLALVVPFLPPAAEAATTYRMTYNATCTYTWVPGWDSPGSYRTTCKNGYWWPASLDIRLRDHVEFRSSAHTYYGEPLCPERTIRYDEPGTYGYACDPDAVPVIRVTGPRVAMTLGPEDRSNVEGTVRFEGVASDGAGLARLEHRLSRCGSTCTVLRDWRALPLEGDATTGTWSIDLDTLPLLRAKHRVEVRATSAHADGMAHTLVRDLYVANPEHVDVSAKDARWVVMPPTYSHWGEAGLEVTVHQRSNAALLKTRVLAEYLYDGQWQPARSVDTWIAGTGTRYPVVPMKGLSLAVVGEIPVRVTLVPDVPYADLDETNNVLERTVTFGYGKGLAGCDVMDATCVDRWVLG